MNHKGCSQADQQSMTFACPANTEISESLGFRISENDDFAIQLRLSDVIDVDRGSIRFRLEKG